MNIIAYSNSIYDRIFADLKEQFIIVSGKKALTRELITKNAPQYIFFPHWSYKIPYEIYKNYNCIIFHMTDLPFGRGGSPLQNLIVRGIQKTKITAFRCVEEMDAGPVYLKRSLSLAGAAEKIYLRAARIIRKMILQIEQGSIIPTPQQGRVVHFIRRTPLESNIEKLNDLSNVYDYIRMLDADNYPHAYLETDSLRFEFVKAKIKNNSVQASVIITKKDDRS